MKEPTPLLSGEATALERKLLGAMAEERPSPELSAIMAGGLSVPAGSATLGKTVGLTLGKGSALLALALALGGAGTVAVLSSRSTLTTSQMPAAIVHTPASAPPEQARVSAVALAPALPEPGVHPESSAVAAMLDSTQAASSASAADSQRPSRAANRARSELAEPRMEATSSISEEIRLLDAAKQRLRGGAPGDAARMLDEYRSRFPRGALGQEATVLRIEALEKSGQHDQALALARRFVQNHPSTTYVERVSRLVGGLGDAAAQRSGASTQ